jgi:hypothetical protein
MALSNKQLKIVKMIWRSEFEYKLLKDQLAMETDQTKIAYL